jgi:hypothetical protein
MATPPEEPPIAVVAVEVVDVGILALVALVVVGLLLLLLPLLCVLVAIRDDLLGAEKLSRSVAPADTPTALELLFIVVPIALTEPGSMLLARRSTRLGITPPVLLRPLGILALDCRVGLLPALPEEVLRENDSQPPVSVSVAACAAAMPLDVHKTGS